MLQRVPVPLLIRPSEVLIVTTGMPMQRAESVQTSESRINSEETFLSKFENIHAN
jgi:hypothetical protein